MVRGRLTQEGITAHIPATCPKFSPVRQEVRSRPCESECGRVEGSRVRWRVQDVPSWLGSTRKSLPKIRGTFCTMLHLLTCPIWQWFVHVLVKHVTGRKARSCVYHSSQYRPPIKRIDFLPLYRRNLARTPSAFSGIYRQKSYFHAWQQKTTHRSFSIPVLGGSWCAGYGVA